MRSIRRVVTTVAVALVAVGAVAVPRAFGQAARATLAGTVRNPQGAAQPGVTVTVVSLDTQNERQAITEMDGTYVVGGLLPGRYQVRVGEAGLAPFQSPVLTLAAGQRQTVDIALRPAAAPAGPAPAAPAPAGQGARATVAGTVRNPQGGPQSGVTVTVVNADTQNERQAITEADGTYVVGGLLPGRYQVRVGEAAFVPFQSPVLTLAAGQRQTVDVALRAVAAPAGPAPGQGARATVTGTVRNAQGAAQPSATVTIINLDTQNERAAVTEMDGTFVVGGLAPGRYQVKVDEAGSAAFDSGAFSLSPGQRRTIDVRLRALPRQARSRATAPPPRQRPSGLTCEPVPAAAQAAAAPGTPNIPDYIPCPDRWRLEFPVWQRYTPELEGDFPYVTGRKLDPYNRNVLKGDYPVAGNDVFFVLTAVSETPFEFRRVPTPGGVSTARSNTEPFFGKPEQTAVASEAIVSIELFKGDTSFKPRSWAFRVTPVFNTNYVNLGEYNNVNATPEEGKTRLRRDVALQEAFGEVKLADVGPNYDFVSVRGGIQPFTSDFRGFLFRDTNLGVRAFGTWGRNRNQWNVAWFDQLEKETNSELNLTERRDQKVIIANYFRQDFGTQGYTISPSFHANFDRGEAFYDANGFLVRPSPIGLFAPHEVKAYYAGLGGDGHWGRLNISHQFYQAFGEDEFNGIAGRKVEINAQFAAVEASVDRDWWRFKGSVIWASGDKDPDDEKAEGFDSILDNPNIAGGPFSFWNREGLRLTQTFVGLKGRSSLLPSLRSSKTEGQASFVNPGLFAFNVGWSAAVTPKLNLSVDANLLRFVDTSSLSRVLFQSGIDKSIGTDVGVGVVYRPALNDNVIITAGTSVFVPSAGFKNLLTSEPLFAPFVVLSLRY